jgi:dinuclear metal center YbgI/SA1388 family protein
MEEIAPLSLACEWDHVGLMVGNLNGDVTGILTCLDVTMDVLEEAVSDGRNMIISHHPFIFHPLTEIDYASPRGRLVAFAVAHGLHIYSAHTNLDYAERGVNWALAQQLGLEEVHWDRNHHHLVGKMNCNSKMDLYAKVADRLMTSLRGIECLDFCCTGQVCVGISSGAFDGETQWCIEEGIQVLITGEVKHSDAVDLAMMPFMTISAGHFKTERWIAQMLADEFGSMARFSLRERPVLPEIYYLEDDECVPCIIKKNK